MNRPLRINLVVRDNGLGLSRDARLLANALQAHAVELHISKLGENDEQLRWRYGQGRRLRAAHLRHTWARWRGRQAFDLNIMFEHLWPLQLPLARYNIAIPNPEWFDHRDLAHLSRIDQVWAKTGQAEQLFRQLGKHTRLIGFDSDDCYDAGVPRERAFFHLAGGSRVKGTERLLALWQRHPQWPLLTVVQNPSCAQRWPAQANIRHCIEYIDDAQLRSWQNQHRFHLCPSQAEGWGHYLVEALSVGATVITLDAPPMNELVTRERGLLVPAQRDGEMGQVPRWQFDDAAMAQAIEQALQLDEAALDSFAAHGRQWFAQNRAAFHQRVGEALAAFNS